MRECLITGYYDEIVEVKLSKFPVTIPSLSSAIRRLLKNAYGLFDHPEVSIKERENPVNPTQVGDKKKEIHIKDLC
jgi:hypothetical protein